MTTTLDVVDPADGVRSLREAITRANTIAGADTIVLPAGVYRIALAGAGENGNATGDLDIRDGVTIQGAGVGLTVIDGRQLDRVFDVYGPAPESISVVLQGLTVRNGNATGDGGGIWVTNANLIVRNIAVTGNRASLTGGGISDGGVAGTDVRVVRTVVSRNVAGTDGGGLSVGGSSSPVLRDSTIRRNIASGTGGGIFADTVTLSNCTVSGNVAGASGGGIYALTANLTNSGVGGNSRRRRRRRHPCQYCGDAHQQHRPAQPRWR